MTRHLPGQAARGHADDLQLSLGGAARDPALVEGLPPLSHDLLQHGASVEDVCDAFLVRPAHRGMASSRIDLWLPRRQCAKTQTKTRTSGRQCSAPDVLTAVLAQAQAPASPRRIAATVTAPMRSFGLERHEEVRPSASTLRRTAA